MQTEIRIFDYFSLQTIRFTRKECTYINYNKSVQKLLDIAEEEGYFCQYIALNRYLDLSGTKACIFNYILSFTVYGKDEDGYCFASRENMAKALNISLSTLDANLKKLVSEKLICKTSTVSHNRFYPMYCANIDLVLKLVLERKRAELDDYLDRINSSRTVC